MKTVFLTKREVAEKLRMFSSNTEVQNKISFFPATLDVLGLTLFKCNFKELWRENATPKHKDQFRVKLYVFVIRLCDSALFHCIFSFCQGKVADPCCLPLVPFSFPANQVVLVWLFFFFLVKVWFYTLLK